MESAAQLQPVGTEPARRPRPYTVVTDVLIVPGEQRGRPGKWIVDYRDQRDSRRRWLTCSSEAEAWRIAAEIKRRGYYDRPAKATAAFDAYARHWLVLSGGRVIPRTVRLYESLTENHLIPAFGSRTLASITRLEIKDLVSAKAGALAGGTCRMILVVLTMILDEAVEDGFLAFSPATGLSKRLPKRRTDGPRKSMTKDEVVRFMTVARASGSAYANAFALMFRTGLRVSEALALTWSDVNVDAGILYVRESKTGRPRQVDIKGADMRAMLSALRNGTERVFPGTYQGARQAFKRIAKAAGLNPAWSTHVARHSYATLMLEAGASLVYVQRQLGHASISMTADLYSAHARPADGGAADALAVAVPVAGEFTESHK
jgi:integrase